MREWLSLKQFQFEVSTGVSMLEPAEKTAICIQLPNNWIISSGIVILYALCTNCVFGSMYQSHSQPFTPVCGQLAVVSFEDGLLYAW